jgi:hypothetical protein
MRLLALLLLAQVATPGGAIFPHKPPPPASPWAYYPLNDSSDGTIHDQGPNGLDLTVTANGSYPLRTGPWRFFTRKDTTGIMAQASNYGRIDMISPATIHAVTQTHSTFAFSFLRAPIDGGTGLEEPLQFGGGGVNAGGDGHGEMIEVRAFRTAGTCSGDRLALVFTDSGSTSRTACFTYAITDNVPFHAAIIMDPTSAGHFTPRLYINGVLHDSTAEQLDPLLFSKSLDGGYVGLSLRRTLVPVAGQVGGYLRNVAIYTRVLTADEIRDLAAQ